jgi:hypothetical protein
MIRHRSTPKLTDKERADRLAAGQCFVCGGNDHFSRDCPSTRIVRSNTGKPPGTASFNIEPAIEELESDGVEILDGLPVGVMSLEIIWSELASSTSEEMDVPPWPLDEWKDHYPYWGQKGILARRMMGDSYVMVANTVLTLGQPYPGDERYPSPDNQRPETWPEMRFTVCRRRSEFTIHDALVEEQISIEGDLLKNP